MKKVWILIYIYHGLIQEPELFFNKEKALKRKKEIFKDFNPDYEELEVFEKLMR